MDRVDRAATCSVSVLLSFFVAVSLVCWLPTFPAQAETLNIDTVVNRLGNWTVGFSKYAQGCVAAVRYKDQTTLWIGFKSDGSAFIAFTNPRWQSIEPGMQFRAQMNLTRNWTGEFFGFQGINEKGLYSSGLKDEFFDDLVASVGMRVYVNQKLIAQLSLSGASAAVVAAVQCTERYVQGPDKRPERPKPKGGSFGTGFFVSAQGHILTNNHVVEGCSLINAVFPGSPEVSAKVIAKDKTNDLALIKTPMTSSKVPALSSRVRVGQTIFVFGFPLAEVLASSGNFTSGTVTALAGLADDSRHVQIQAPVQPGNSGGPLIDRYGNVVGIVIAKLDVLAAAPIIHDIPQNVNFAVKSVIAINFLNSVGLSPIEEIKSRELPPEEVAELARAFTVHISCDTKSH